MVWLEIYITQYCLSKIFIFVHSINLIFLGTSKMPPSLTRKFFNVCFLMHLFYLLLADVLQIIYSKKKKLFSEIFCFAIPFEKKIPEIQTKPYSSCLPTDDIINMAVMTKKATTKNQKRFFIFSYSFMFVG